MDYRSALGRLLQLVDHERITAPTRTRIRYDLRRMEALLRSLENPHLGIPTVHIAGTKGKGSTAAMCASVLSQQGYTTGLFTSPHLHSFRERIRLNGEPVSEDQFASLVEEVWPALERVSVGEDCGEVTMFEALTAMAFCHFRRWADFQVLEVGLGGRLDTTNLVSPDVCAITSLSLDHTSVLGDTIEAIAAEKAGIIKPGVPVVSAPQTPEPMAVIESLCVKRGSELIVVGDHLNWHKGHAGHDGQGLTVTGRLGNYDLWTPLLGEYQLENVAVSVGVLEVLEERGFHISGPAMDRGFREVDWPCRMEVLQRDPLVICDGAHNPQSVARLRDSLPSYFDYRRVILVVGVSQDKDLEGMVKELASLLYPERRSNSKDPAYPGATSGADGERSRVIVTRSRHPRSTLAAAVADAFVALEPSGLSADRRRLELLQVDRVDNAVARAVEEAAKDGPGTLVLVTGSLFVAAEAREAIYGIEPELYPESQADPFPLSR